MNLLAAATTQQEPRKSQQVITVCSHCLTESCWNGVLVCAEYKTAGTVTDTEENIARMIAPEESENAVQRISDETRALAEDTFARIERSKH